MITEDVCHGVNSFALNNSDALVSLQIYFAHINNEIQVDPTQNHRQSSHTEHQKIGIQNTQIILHDSSTNISMQQAHGR